MRKKKSEIARQVGRIARMLYLRDNANDGRYRSKHIKNKRKEQDRKSCRKWRYVK